MRTRSTVRRLLMAAVCGGALLSAPIATGPTALAAPCTGSAVLDPITGTCWTSGQGPITGTGGVCIPGRLGLCLGALANSQIPGDNLGPQNPAGANRAGDDSDTWP